MIAQSPTHRPHALTAGSHISVSLLCDRYRCLARRLAEATFGEGSTAEVITVRAAWTDDAIGWVPPLAPEDVHVAIESNYGGIALRMGKRCKQLTFTEFGQQFIEHAMTPEIIRATLARIIPEEQQFIIANPTSVTIHARTMIEDILHLPYEAAGDELVFEVPLAIHLALWVNMLVGQEQYTAVATTRLRLAARVCTPLVLKIDCPPVDPGQIMVASEGQGNWFDLLKRFGLLDVAIRQQVADMANQHIEQSRRHRRIDLRKLIAEFVEDMTRTTVHHARQAQPRRRAPARGQLTRLTADEHSVSPV